MVVKISLMFKTGIDENCLKCPDLGCLFTTYLWHVGCINKTKFAIKKRNKYDVKILTVFGSQRNDEFLNN